MATFFSHLFYLFGITVLIREFFSIMNPLSHTLKIERFSNFVKEHNGKKLDKLPPEVRNDLFGIFFYALYSISIFVWGFLGLLTFNWIVFAVFLAFSILICSPISKLIRKVFGYGKAYTVYHVIGSIVDFGLIGFAIINQYHLRIDLMQLF